MPGSLTFRPIEAKLTHDTSTFSKMDPYCAFVVGEHVYRGAVCKKGGQRPQWENVSVTVPFNNEPEISLEVMDKDKFMSDDHVGTLKLNTSEIKMAGTSTHWYPLTYLDKPAGEILLEASYSDKPPSVVEELEGKEVIGTKPCTTIGEKTITQSEDPLFSEGKTFTEQKQFIEPRTFEREIDVTETRERTEMVEVTEPVKITKNVECTEAVPVTKEIEITEPVVVKKQVEVMEPQLVEKKIQVVESVPVMKEVEVIENVTRTEQVETLEPKTYTKPVEVIEQVPVKKEVTVTEPVHMKKTVECVEPVTTTQTITKEIKEPVVVGEKVTTTVGPATVLKEHGPYGELYAHWVNLSDEERGIRVKEWGRMKAIGMTDLEIEKDLAGRGWIKLEK